MFKKAVIYYGPASGFRDFLDERIDPSEKTVEFLSAIRGYNHKIRQTEYANPDYDPKSKFVADACIARTNDYGSVLTHAVANFAGIINEAYDVTTLYLQNPPKQVASSIHEATDQVETKHYEYKQIDKEGIKRVYESLMQDVLDQDQAKRAIAESLYKLSVTRYKHPCVLLFLGPSGVGKTETAKAISTQMGGRLSRIQLSMMQTSEGYSYMFGDEHSKPSLARDLLSRESNIVLFDEFDKVNNSLYNAFYQLFDEGIFVDTNYEVDVRNCIFICTANFHSAREARKALGPAMFSRIAHCIPFSALSDASKRVIVERAYGETLAQLDPDETSTIENSDIEDWSLENVSRYKNMRTMKTKLDNGIWGTLTDKLLGT